MNDKVLKEAKIAVKVTLIPGAVFALAAVICYIVGLTCKIPVLGGIALFAIFIAVVFLIIGCSKAVSYKKTKASFENKSSLANKTYGKSEEYVHFVAYYNKKAQAAKNAAVNTLSALTSVFGMGGVFVSGANGWDVFVSTDKIILNCPNQNVTYSDNKFKIIETSKIKKVEFETVKGFERVKFTMRDTEKTFALDVVSKTPETNALVKQTFEEIIKN